MRNQLEHFSTQLTEKLQGKRICYIDYPAHFNFGDSLIFLGSLELLKKAKIEIVGCFTAHQIISNPLLIEQSGCDSIVFHGGGNFGDIYELHQRVRRIVINNYPKKHIVIFPQTIFYQNKKNIEKDKDIFSQHANLDFFVRDIRSQKFLKDEFNINAILSIDTAHFLYENLILANARFHRKKSSKLNDFLFLIRRDCEKSTEIQKKIVSEERHQHNEKDWDSFFNNMDVLFRKSFTFISRLFAKNTFISSKLYFLWLYFLNIKLNFILKEFSQYNHVTTDRLHGYILCTLLEVDCTPLDNSYGKLSAYRELWKSKIE